MKKTLLILSVALLSLHVTAQQQPFLQWQKSLGGSGLDKIRSIKQTNDNGYIIAGHTFSNDGDVKNNHGNNDYWIIKLNAEGNLEWQKTYGGSSYDYAISTQQTTDGGYVVAGYTYSNDGDVTGNHGGYDYWVIKLDASGKKKWQKTYGGTGDDFANSIQQTVDGGYIVAGSSASNDGDVTNNHGNADYWIIKLDAAGNLKWQKTFGGAGNDQSYSVQQTNDSGYIVAGYTDTAGRLYDYFIIKLDAAGKTKWQKKYGGSLFDVAYSAAQTADGGYIVAGYSSSADGDVTGNHGGYDYWILKLSSTGALKWQKSLGGTGNDYGYYIQQTTTNDYIVTGASNSNDGDVHGNHGSYDYWIATLNTAGKLKWQIPLGGTGEDYSYSGCTTTGGGYIAAGYSYSNNGNVTVNKGSGDYWVAKLSADILNNNIMVESYKPAPDCSSSNSISFKIINDTASYKVILYRFGVPYDSILNVTDHANFNKLPSGFYYATAIANKIISTSNAVSLLPSPANTATTNITSAEARLNWTGFNCTDHYTILYHVKGTKQWSIKDTTALVYILKDLMPATTYIWKVASQKSKNGITATSKYSDSMTFATNAALMADSNQPVKAETVKVGSTQLTASPNPAKNSFKIFFTSATNYKVSATLYDVNGKNVWSSGLINANDLNGKQVNVSQFAKGIFYLKLTNNENDLISSTKVVIAK